MSLRIGYIIPEFPGQTHIWMWREIVWTRRWAEVVHIYSTRQPPERDRARHEFAKTSQEMTTFLWPAPVWSAMLWAIFCHPIGFLRCIALCFSLPVEKRPRAVHLLKLVPSACFLAKDAQARGLQHLHSHSCANAAVLAMMVKRLIGMPYSLTLNANIEWWGGAMREKFGDAAFTIAITQWLLAQMKREFPDLREDQAILGRIGVDTLTWLASPREEHGRPFRLITVGRLHESKGHDVLLDAMAKLVEAGRDISLRMIGDGPQRAELERKTISPLLAGRVKFLGSMAEHQIQAELRSADAFVLASHAEPLGVVYMEAMAAGVPTIGTNAGGVGEIITDGHDGILVPPRDPDALATAIARMIDDPELAKKLAESARATIVQRFDSRLGAATLYTRVTGNEPPNTPVAEQRRSA